jgi:DNA-binding winged helix-turn-helix (wHTH) protein
MRYSVMNVDLDPDSFEICINGLPVQAEPRVLEFIFYLFQHRERMVSKHELLEQVWHTDSISESVLTRAACLARRLLVDSRFIRTVYGRGYQWRCPVLLTKNEDEAAPKARGASGTHRIRTFAELAINAGERPRSSTKFSATR